MITSSLRAKTLFITGASRGIGLAIALRAARDGANIVVAAKTSQPHKHLPGTVFTAAKEIEAAGGKALPVVLDVRDAANVDAAVAKAVETFGGIDICINNASAISLTATQATTAKTFDLLQQVNVRGTFLVSRACIPHLQRAENPHILTLSPPLDLDPKWLGPHIPYTLSKYGMSLLTLGMAAEFLDAGIAVNSLWPISTIDTSAVRFALGGEAMAERSRSPTIMADAAHAILTKPSRSYTGHFALDELCLREVGMTNFEAYGPSSGGPLQPDFFVPDSLLASTPTRFLQD